MVWFILTFGTLTLWAGLEILRRPSQICGFLRKNSDRTIVHVLNVAIRVVFGLSLLSLTSLSRFPLVTDTIGWFCLGIALLVAFMSRSRFIKSILWAITLIEENNRLAGFLVMIFGVFLVYAFF